MKRNIPSALLGCILFSPCMTTLANERNYAWRRFTKGDPYGRKFGLPSQCDSSRELGYFRDDFPLMHLAEESPGYKSASALLLD